MAKNKSLRGSTSTMSLREPQELSLRPPNNEMPSPRSTNEESHCPNPFLTDVSLPPPQANNLDLFPTFEPSPSIDSSRASSEQLRTPSIHRSTPPFSPISNHNEARRAYFERLRRSMLTLQEAKTGFFGKQTEKIRGAQGGGSLIGNGLLREQYALKEPEAYTKPFCDFLTENPTVWHAVGYFEGRLERAGFQKLSGRAAWNSKLEKGGKFYTTRNGSSLVAFTIGNEYKAGNGIAMIAAHIDALTARLKPISTKQSEAGYMQLGVAPYAGGMNETWWDRDLGIGGRVLVQDKETGKISSRLVKLDWPVAKISTLAPHFGLGMTGSNNKETEMVPIIGLTSSSEEAPLGAAGSFTTTQPPALIRAIAKELSISDYVTIINWELELFDIQPAQVLGLDRSLISAGRIDDKLCSWSALEALLSSSSTSSKSSTVKLVALVDNEEIGSETRQGARGTLLSGTVSRIVESFSDAEGSAINELQATYANSFLLSADVIHAAHPNFLHAYEETHIPSLNTGLVIHANFGGHATTDAVSTAILQRIATKLNAGELGHEGKKVKQQLQYFLVKNGMRSGSTVGPMLSTATGVNAIDVGQPMLGMHSLRATTGALDPGLGVGMYWGFLEGWEGVGQELDF